MRLEWCGSSGAARVVALMVHGPRTPEGSELVLKLNASLRSSILGAEMKPSLARPRARTCSVVMAWVLGCSPTIELGSDRPIEGTTTAEPGDSGPGATGTRDDPSGGVMDCSACGQVSCSEEFEQCALDPACACFLDCIDERGGIEGCPSECDNAPLMPDVLRCLGMNCETECSDLPSDSGSD